MRLWDGEGLTCNIQLTGPAWSTSLQVDALYLENNQPTNQIALQRSHDYILKSGASFRLIDPQLTIMASFRGSRPALPPCEVGTKRKHGVNQAMEEYKENLGPAGNSRRKRPKLDQPVKVKLIYTIFAAYTFLCPQR